MNEPDQAPEAQRWMRYAQEDLDAAKLFVGAQTTSPRHACFHAQQCAEKAIKAILVFLNIDFPRTHDLEKLQMLLPNTCSTKQLEVLPYLSDWAVHARYPADWPDPTADDASEAVQQAETALRSAREDLAAAGFLDSR